MTDIWTDNARSRKRVYFQTDVPHIALTFDAEQHRSDPNRYHVVVNDPVNNVWWEDRYVYVDNPDDVYTLIMVCMAAARKNPDSVYRDTST